MNERALKKKYLPLMRPVAVSISVEEPPKNGKQLMIEEMISKLQTVNTFASIGTIIGYSRQFVSKRLLPEYKKNPSIMSKLGDDYRIPRATAEWFIKRLYEY